MFLDRRLIDQLSRHKILFTASIFCGVLTGAGLLAQAWLLSSIVDQVFLQHRDLECVSHLIVGFLIAGLLRSFASYGQGRFSADLAYKVKLQLRSSLFGTLYQAGPIRVRKLKTGDISAVLMQGIDKLDAFFNHYLPQIVLAALIPLLILFFVFPTDTLSGVVFLTSAPLIPFFMVLIGSTTDKLTRKQWRTLRFLSGHFFDVIQGLTTLKLFNRSKEQIRQISSISRNYRHATMNILKIAFLSALVLELVATLCTAIVAVEIGLRLLYGKLVFRQALFILLLAPDFYQPLRLLGARFHAGTESVTAAQSIFQLLEQMSAEIPEGRVKCNLNQEAISFVNVSFDYEDQPDTLQNITFRIEPGTMTAVVGGSGSGKSTLLNLLLGFVHPSAGDIFVGDNSLRHLDRKHYLSQIATVPQSPYLFPMSIRENLMFFNAEATKSQLEEAISRAGLSDWLCSVPGGLDAQVGELAFRVSGGEAQRIALARAFLRNASLYIFDEPSANLDLETEAIIQRAIQEISKTKTVFVVAHRLNTIQHADQILVLHKGKLVEVGTHKELFQKEGRYAKMLAHYARIK